ncbi:hypothetical protein GCM10011585_24600 [Edaphobacter dinghuensis]|uniref:Uncharacterized protein n=1 Tax=Edaphobacter dinghuensis TaxID=1560005 RepID=A0A917HHX4_9BACT|nr:hypothetical protein GCM10011585_24600 [Edaphobacter dinghuensis]
MLDFKPNENLGLVEFHGLWNGIISVWLWWREWHGGTCRSGGKSVGGKLVDCGTYAHERLHASGSKRIQPRDEL